MRCMSCLSARLLANHAAATADLSCGLHVLLQDISGGEVILRVPLALAITDYMEDAQREALPGRVNTRTIKCLTYALQSRHRTIG